MSKSKIIAIHFGHNATVAYLENGEIKICISEERFNRIKNSTGWPTEALKYVHEQINGQADYYAIAQEQPWGYKILKRSDFQSTAPGKVSYRDKRLNPDWKTELQLRLMPGAYYKRIKNKLLMSLDNIKADTALKQEMDEHFARLLDTGKEKIIYVDHHLCHALSVPFFLRDRTEPTLIFTLDGEGDGLCATVTKFENGQYKVVSQVNRAYSPGLLYLHVTGYLGMKPNEHEFKVMGLAPYAKEEYSSQLTEIFSRVLWLNDRDEFESDIPMAQIHHYLKKELAYRRFDNIAGAIQKFTEDITIDWVRRWVKKTGVSNIGVSGGVFMNVKMNQRIAEQKEIDYITVVPSGGDESLVIGAAYYAHNKLNQNKEADIKRLSHLYLGISYSKEEIEKALNKNDCFNKYEISEPEELNKKIAQLVAANKVVARLGSPMEFGARALGNRSILANPSSYENVRLINEMIKNRDFWMPFATSILEEEAGRYIINPKKIEAPYMNITFHTTEAAHAGLQAAIHPYDKTSRPQIVSRTSNPDYHEIISEFKKLTNIGGILNTSFNLHGEPIVMSPDDALKTFANSGLNYLALGPYLIQKKQ